MLPYSSFLLLQRTRASVGSLRKENTRKRESEANTRLVRFPPIEFSFEKDVERHVQYDTPRITTS